MFLYEHIGKATNQNLEDLTVESTLEQLKTFMLVYKEEKEKPIVLLTKPSFYCKKHGNNTTHVTEDCRAIQYEKRRDQRDSNRLRSGERDRRRISSDNFRRERSYSSDREDQHERGEYHRNNRRRTEGTRDSRDHTVMNAEVKHEKSTQQQKAIKSHQEVDKEDNLFRMNDY